MARRVSATKKSKTLEPDEEEKNAQRKAMDQLELRKLMREAKKIKELRMRDSITEKQLKVIRVLGKEKFDLQNNLKQMRSTTRCASDLKQAQDIVNLFAQGDDHDEAIAVEKKYIQDLESQIQKETQNIYVAKKEKGGSFTRSDYFAKQENDRAERTLGSWKSRLAAEQHELSLAIKANEDLRKKVHLLLKSKAQFNKLFEDLMGKLKKGKRIMVEIVEQSRQQFQKRDEVRRKIEALKSRDKADLAKRKEEMQDLEMRLYEDKKLANFRHRLQLVREKMEDGIRHSKKENVEQERLISRLHKVIEFWDKLKETTELTDAEEICYLFRKEDSNLFAMFNHNNEIRDQLEALTQKTAELMRTVDDEQTVAEERLDSEIEQKTLMEGKLNRLEQSVNDMSDHYNANARLFSRLLDKIKTLFDMTKCSTSSLKELLGNNMEVTEYNYRLYLGLIETEIISFLEAVTPMDTKISRSATLKRVVSWSSKSLKSKSLPASSVHSRFHSSSTIVDKKVVTRGCWECDGISKRRVQFDT